MPICQVYPPSSPNLNYVPLSQIDDPISLIMWVFLNVLMVNLLSLSVFSSKSHHKGKESECVCEYTHAFNFLA